MTDKREINEYLYHEFGAEGAESRIAVDWPFQLSEVGSFSTSEGETRVFHFSDEGKSYFAVAGRSLTYYPKEGMEVRHVRQQAIGARWIADQDPVDLDTSWLANASVPPTVERRRDIEELAREHLGDTEYSIGEGLFLRASGRYLALIQPAEGDEAVIVGTDITVRKIPFPTASAWRRLAIGVGSLIEQGRLGRLRTGSSSDGRDG